MSKFSIGFAQEDSTRSGSGAAQIRASTAAQARINANVRRHFSYFWGYVAILGFLTLVAGASMSLALWRLMHFAR